MKERLRYRCPFRPLASLLRCFDCPFGLPPGYRYDGNICCLSSRFREEHTEAAIDHLIYVVNSYLVSAQHED